MSDAKKNISEETRKKMSEAKRGNKHNFFGKTHSEESKLKMSKTRGTTIYLYSLDYQFLNTFPSSRAAAKHFKCGDPMIMKYARSGKIFKDQYILSLKELPSSSGSSLS